MELVKEKVTRIGREFMDLSLVWEYEGKTYCVRVRPVFARDYDKLFGVAQDVTK